MSLYFPEVTCQSIHVGKVGVCGAFVCVASPVVTFTQISMHFILFSSVVLIVDDRIKIKKNNNSVVVGLSNTSEMCHYYSSNMGDIHIAKPIYILHRPYLVYFPVPHGDGASPPEIDLVTKKNGMLLLDTLDTSDIEFQMQNSEHSKHLTC